MVVELLNVPDNDPNGKDVTLAWIKQLVCRPLRNGIGLETLVRAHWGVLDHIVLYNMTEMCYERHRKVVRRRLMPIRKIIKQERYLLWEGSCLSSIVESSLQSVDIKETLCRWLRVLAHYKVESDQELSHLMKKHRKWIEANVVCRMEKLCRREEDATVSRRLRPIIQEVQKGYLDDWLQQQAEMEPQGQIPTLSFLIRNDD